MKLVNCLYSSTILESQYEIFEDTTYLISPSLALMYRIPLAYLNVRVCF